MPNKLNYEERLSTWNNIVLEEKHALISHAIQLRDTIEAQKYRDTLAKNGIELDELPSAEAFNLKNDITLTPKESAFTFIDLFGCFSGLYFFYFFLGD